MKAKHLLFALFALALGAASCENDTPTTPNQEPKKMTIKLRSTGETDAQYNPLTRFTPDDRDLYGIQVWHKPATTGSYERYAYGLFDSFEDVEIEVTENYKFITFGGDGGTYDIGFQSLSGAMERNHDMVYVCYDNGAYMNTGIQRSSATPMEHFLMKTVEKLQIPVQISATTSDWMKYPGPAIKMGPGLSARSHKADEFIGIDEIAGGIEGYINFIKNI